jgi:hypothetical protein
MGVFGGCYFAVLREFYVVLVPSEKAQTPVINHRANVPLLRILAGRYR